jgi:ElaA protein
MSTNQSLSFSCKYFTELTLEELYYCMQLRQEVFVVEQDCPYIDADGKDPQSWHLMGWHKGQLVAYTRIVPKGISYPDYVSIGRVVTHHSVRRGGYGKQLMKESIRQARQLFPDQPIKISAQCYLIEFYESFGFQAVGKEYEEDGIPHIAMKMN